MKKGDILEGIVSRVDYPNKGIVVAEQMPFVVKNVIPGQKIRFAVKKTRKDHGEGRLLEVLEPSPLEVIEPACSLFPDCGGCTYQTMDYGAQLEMKSEQVRRLLDEALRQAGQTDEEGNPDYVFEGIEGSPQQWRYRNKMEFTFGDDHPGGPLTLGLHKKNSMYDILTAKDCMIVPEDLNRILSCVLDFFTDHPQPFYHRVRHSGFLRHLLVRRSLTTGDILVCLVTTSQADPDLSGLVRELTALLLDGRIAGVIHMIHDGLADVVQSEETRILYGVDYFYETVLGLRFKITPFSFFQTNTAGAEVLYDTARKYIGDTKDKVVFDLYSGTGTIAQILADVAREVVGVEIVEEAVEAAGANAIANGLDNCRFIAGDVLKVLDTVTERPDVIVLDPPRDGIHPKALEKIIAYGVERIVYISCKPTSLARDLLMLAAGGYRMERAKCVDMFVGAAHIETAALFCKTADSIRRSDTKARE